MFFGNRAHNWEWSYQDVTVLQDIKLSATHFLQGHLLYGTERLPQ